MRIHPILRTSHHYILLVLTLVILSGCAASDPVQKNSNPGQPKELTNFDDEGMWLLHQIEGDLFTSMTKRGWKIAPDSLYNSDSPSLNQTIVRINIGQNLGGTGSFVSPEGLILANHSIAYNALSSASNPENNYLENGFYAGSIPNEVPLPNYNIYIPIEQREVTDQIKNQLPDSLTYRERLIKTQKIRKQLIAHRKANNPNLVVEINDFWGGNRQFMSTFKIIRDVRLVHAPPESLALGTSKRDWPQFAGDYAFLRAYVSPDGNSRKYHRSNVPFTPARQLKVKANGISNRNFTVVMGFPGETSRHESSHALDFYHNQRNPITIDSYQAILDGLQYTAEQNPSNAYQSAAQRTSLKNAIDYYEGLQKGVKRQHIIEEKKRLEQAFEEWIKQDSLRQKQYRRILDQLDQAYNIASQTGDLLHATVYTINNNQLFQIASLYDSHRKLLENNAHEKITPSYKDSLLTKHQTLLSAIDIEAQHIKLSKMLYMLASLPDGKVIFHLLELFEGKEGQELKKEIDRYLKTQHQQSIVYDLERARIFLNLPTDSARKTSTDKFVELYRALMESYQFSRKNYVQYVAYQRPAHKRYIQGMLQFKPDLYSYPDANGTQRISTGQVKGYHLQDSLSYTPFTTLDAISSDTKSTYPFEDPYSSSNDSLVVNFLSTNDVTGGNSGSPVLNGNGELVGITFDNTSQATASDYKYDSARSRTISVNMEYILFLMEKLKADKLLDEMDASK